MNSKPPVGVLPEPGELGRLYILNEGVMGMGNSSIDFYDFADGTYVTDAFPAANPDVPFGLGDTGNDLAVYGGKLWAVMNGSNLVEVMDALTIEHIMDIDVPACRNITFSGRYAYVTSWAGNVSDDGDRTGMVYRIDINSLSIAGTVEVGYQPEDIAALDGKIYVANSGGMTDGYDNRLSIIDEESFSLERTVEIAANICDIAPDAYGRLWISSPGDYYSVHSGIYVYDIASGTVLKSEPGAVLQSGAGVSFKSESGANILPEWINDIRVSSMYSTGSHLWVLGNENEWDYTAGAGKYCLYTIDCQALTMTRTELSRTGAESISNPYGIWVSPDEKTIAITDAASYTEPGYILFLDANLNFVSSFQTGFLPGHFAVLE
ncbi:MAG: hypothetical protein IAB91_01645 [Bacteroidetes bacterium]|uniref:YncE family protein n=1 Tax=Candidatus Cryptobacteroides faecigallinarum TaxID=2840763 RepID=A0A9D9ILN1_9BACT|nr:hypothetical protein [Candidatus Cryptobacteroides faecigallinarum]